jgi:hypothetical protein
MLFRMSTDAMTLRFMKTTPRTTQPSFSVTSPAENDQALGEGDGLAAGGDFDGGGFDV